MRATRKIKNVASTIYQILSTLLPKNITTYFKHKQIITHIILNMKKIRNLIEQGYYDTSYKINQNSTSLKQILLNDNE